MAFGGVNPALEAAQAAALAAIQRAAAVHAAQQVSAQGGIADPSVMQGGVNEAAQAAQQQQEHAQHVLALAHSLATTHLGQGPQYFPPGYSTPQTRELYADGVHARPGGPGRPLGPINSFGPYTGAPLPAPSPTINSFGPYRGTGQL